ncbi:MAG: DUF1659 domain-containing protein [Clostridia bacterium]|nr:DUF1659 domain-containing protein [Clostridia bacterium]
MPVTTTALARKVRLQFQTGMDGDGEPVYKNKTFSRLKTDAADQDIYDVAQSIASLSAHPLSGVTRLDETDLAEEA